jgi:hypothetical protein
MKLFGFFLKKKPLPLKLVSVYQLENRSNTRSARGNPVSAAVPPRSPKSLCSRRWRQLP